MVAHSGLITVMQKAARKAAPRLRRDFNEVEQLQVSRKGPADFVSMADRAPEQTIVEELRHARPDWRLTLEEGGEIEGDPDKPRWIVDPLDGTTNFLHGIPHFAISIAVEDPRGARAGREITQALVYQPLTDESFWAEKGRGAWLNERRLRVSARRDLADALFATGIPFKGHGDHARFEQDPRCRRARKWPASAASARPRSTSPGSRRAATTASGRRISIPGISPPASSWSARRAASSPTFAARDAAIAKGQVLAANDQLHSRLHKLVAGALRG